MSAIAATPVFQDETYFQHLRHDVVAHIDRSAQRVLSVGCGAGVTEEELQRLGHTVTGIELDAVAAGRARQRGLEVLHGDVNDIDAALAGRQFDCLLYSDVLEHIADPEEILAGNLKHLAPGGSVVISVPNFRYFTVLWQLAGQGLIRYTDAGILDRTHLRITTRRLVTGWLERAGLQSIQWEYRIARRRDRLLNRLGFGLPAEFLAQQIIVTGKVSDAS